MYNEIAVNIPKYYFIKSSFQKRGQHNVGNVVKVSMDLGILQTAKPDVLDNRLTYINFISTVYVVWI